MKNEHFKTSAHINVRCIPNKICINDYEIKLTNKEPLPFDGLLSILSPPDINMCTCIKMFVCHMLLHLLLLVTEVIAFNK